MPAGACCAGYSAVTSCIPCGAWHSAVLVPVAHTGDVDGLERTHTLPALLNALRFPEVLLLLLKLGVLHLQPICEILLPLLLAAWLARLLIEALLHFIFGPLLLLH